MNSRLVDGRAQDLAAVLRRERLDRRLRREAPAILERLKPTARGGAT